ncbi:hypothetical protein GCM10019059_21260 [Camelimonas fluminis]|uniref:O-antigen ligase-like membrane protein n=1 Tax=Camelimonas fluminis TaxID=1576911 RepID=A0ABV7UGW6_9HYPH|nr:hypothetical protein [Camelimonas fluminis]GHE61630.1 hypothetical protein GCM10019059_21260 [Camelimonas fluminis]
MTPSPVGLLVCLVIAIAGRMLGSATLIGLPVSLAFGATAFATLPALGGSSPQIYTLFAICLVAEQFLRRGGVRSLVVSTGRAPMLSLTLLALMVYSVMTAIILPRLFAGETSVFVPVNGAIVETVLAPVTGNISQTAYFVLGIMTCIALGATLNNTGRLVLVSKGLILCALLNVTLGAIDLAAKASGVGDVLEVIRTASYAMLTDVEHAGFFRISGAHSEASAFGAAIFISMVFCSTYSRLTGDRRVGMLAVASLALLLLSTSSSAYGCLAIYMICLAGKALFNLLQGRVRKVDLLLVFAALVCVAAVIAIYLHNGNAFDRIQQLLDAAIFNKASSASAAERGYWNSRSLTTFLETGGLGVGMGSSRASNWLIAVLSQTGVIGAVLQALLAATLLRALPPSRSDASNLPALYEAARMTGLATLVPSLLAGGSADPGMLFFICVAVAQSARQSMQAQAPVAASSPARRLAAGDNVHTGSPCSGPAPVRAVRRT